MEKLPNLIEINIQTGTEGDDVIFGEGGADELFGLGGNDILGGGFGDDYLSGGAGDDLMDGGFGEDQLDGGDGADIVAFENGGSNYFGNSPLYYYPDLTTEVTWMDFEQGVDQIWIEDLSSSGDFEDRLVIQNDEHGDAVVSYDEDSIVITLVGIDAQNVTMQDFGIHDDYYGW